MIQEDRVSFETARLLKEKGFDYASFHCYEEKEADSILFVTLSAPLSNSDLDNTIEPHKCYSAPSLQVAMKWLRSNFNLNPVPYALSLGWAFDIFDLSDRDITGCKKLYSMDFHAKSTCYETYEEAAEAAIRYCLENLI